MTPTGSLRYSPIPSLAVPPTAAHTQVWIDFDGTLTCGDFLDELILRYSRNDSWKIIEERWRAQQIGSRRCLEAEFALLDISAEQLQAELAAVKVDPGAGALLGFLRQWGVPTAILSDGIESFIRQILALASIEPPEIRANTIVHRGLNLSLVCPHSCATCVSDSAHCKCASCKTLSHPGLQSVYIGDGRSDLCAARCSNFVFAKGALAQAFTTEGRAFAPFDDLNDVVGTLARLWGPAPLGVRATDRRP